MSLTAAPVRAGGPEHDFLPVVYVTSICVVFVFVILTQVYSLKSVTLADLNQSVTFAFSTKTASPKISRKTINYEITSTISKGRGDHLSALSLSLKCFDRVKYTK